MSRAFWLGLLLCACPSPKTPSLSLLSLKGPGLQLQLDSHLAPLHPFHLGELEPLPLLALRVDGKPVPLTFRATGTEGSLVATHQGLVVEVQLSTHKRHPHTLFLDAAVQNGGDQEVEVVLETPRLRLKATPKATWAFQGAAIEWGRDYVFRLKPGYRSDNELRARKDYGGGGVPVNDLWRRHGGVTIGHLEKMPRRLKMPIHASSSGAVTTWIEQRRKLPPGARFLAARSFVHLHRGDFFDGVATYRRILVERGVAMAKSPPSAYEPVWCSWGYEFNMRPTEVLGILPKLRELGIGWAVVDDRWFDAYGDWRPRPEIYGGEGDGLPGLVKAIHSAKLRARLWWVPLAVELEGGAYESHRYHTAEVARRHPDWLILDDKGSPALGPRKLGYLCPAVPEVREYYRGLTRRFVGEWGFDGHKLDVLYAVPPCHNPKHRHKRPEASSEALGSLIQVIHQTTRQLKDQAVTEICPCGTTPHFAWLPHMDQAVTADPVGASQVRRRVKLLKALMGPRFAVYADHVELTQIGKDERETGSDFASALGTGAVIGTKFTWPRPTRKLEQGSLRFLDPQKERHWRRWLGLARRKQLARGEYLNLYDLAFHRPETHVVRRNGRLHYGFFTPRTDQVFAGEVLIRAPRGCHEAYDYANDRVLARVNPPERIPVRFTGSLLVELRPCPGSN